MWWFEPFSQYLQKSMKLIRQSFDQQYNWCCIAWLHTSFDGKTIRQLGNCGFTLSDQSTLGLSTNNSASRAKCTKSVITVMLFSPDLHYSCTNEHIAKIYSTSSLNLSCSCKLKEEMQQKSLWLEGMINMDKNY